MATLAIGGGGTVGRMPMADAPAALGKRWRRQYSILVCLVVTLTLVAGWFAIDARRTWSRLDHAAARLHVPDGFREVGRVRQGTALCFVSCTSGGEALVTVVLDAGDMPANAACERLHQAIGAVAQNVEAAPSNSFTCAWNGSLGGQATGTAIVMPRSGLQPLGPAHLYGPRWTEKLQIPPGPLLAWVEFNSKIE